MVPTTPSGSGRNGSPTKTPSSSNKQVRTPSNSASKAVLTGNTSGRKQSTGVDSPSNQTDTALPNPYTKLIRNAAISHLTADGSKRLSASSSNNTKESSQAGSSKVSDSTQQNGTKDMTDSMETVKAIVKRIEDASISSKEEIISNAVLEGFKRKSMRYSNPFYTGPKSQDPTARKRDTTLLPFPSVPSLHRKGSAPDPPHDVLEGAPYSLTGSQWSSSFPNFANAIYETETPCPSPRKPRPRSREAAVSPTEASGGLEHEQLTPTPTPPGSPSPRESPTSFRLEDLSSIMKQCYKPAAIRKLEEQTESSSRERRKGSDPFVESRRSKMSRMKEPEHSKSISDPSRKSLLSKTKPRIATTDTIEPQTTQPVPTAKKEASVLTLPRSRLSTDDEQDISKVHSRSHYRVLSNLEESQEQLRAYRENRTTSATDPPSSSSNDKAKTSSTNPGDITTQLKRNRHILTEMEKEHALKREHQRTEAAQLSSDLKSYYLISEEEIPENDKVIYPENSDVKYAEALRKIERGNSWTGMMQEQEAMRYELLRMQAYFLLEKEQHRQAKERILELEHQLLLKEHAELTNEKQKLLEEAEVKE